MVGDGIVTLAVPLVTDFRNSKSARWIGWAWRTLSVTCITGGAKSTLPARAVEADVDAALGLDALELGQEVDVEIGAAELAVGDAAQAQVLLVAHDSRIASSSTARSAAA